MRKSPRRCVCKLWACGSSRLAACGAAGSLVEVTWPSSTKRSRLHREISVQLEIECQHVNHRLADEAEQTTVLVVAHRVVHLCGADPAHPGHPGHLDIGVGRRDVGVQA